MYNTGTENIMSKKGIRIECFPYRINLFKDLIEELYKEYYFEAKQKSLQFSIKNNSRIEEIIANKYSLKKLLKYLLDISFKLTYRGKISMEVKDINNKVTLDILYTGINISSNTSQTILELLKSGNKEFKSEEGFYHHYVKNLCDENLITISYNSNKEKPSCFTLTFNN